MNKFENLSGLGSLFFEGDPPAEKNQQPTPGDDLFLNERIMDALAQQAAAGDVQAQETINQVLSDTS